MSDAIDRQVADAVRAAELGEPLPDLPNEPRVRDALRRLCDERIAESRGHGDPECLRALLHVALSIAQDADERARGLR